MHNQRLLPTHRPAPRLGRVWEIWILAALLGFWMHVVHCEKIEMFMPPHKVVRDDTYLCTFLKLPKEGSRIVAIEPSSDQSIAHHMLLFGCLMPGNNVPVWECNMARPCKANEQVLYGWGKNAPKLSLPHGVGYSVGGDSSLEYLVLQVHYLSVRPDDDASGVTLTLTDEPSPLTASMIMFARTFSIPPGKESHKIPNSCCLNGFQQVTTMAFRVHTHMMGRSVFMTRTSGLYPEGKEVARNNPQLPQGFYPVEEENKIRPGETLTVTCDFNSSGMDHEVRAGSTHEDEMCNMYMMVYSDIPHFSSCVDDKNREVIMGPGGFPVNGHILTESSLSNMWMPPSSRNSEGNGIEGVTGVARAEDGNIWMLHRADVHWNSDSFDIENKYLGKPIDADVVVELDPDTGLVKRKWGRGLFYMPHFITVDFDGNIWITDTGRHQALKFNKEGKLLMELGVELEPGHDHSHFCKPTHVQIMNDGKIAVADGYCNKRVMFFKGDGEFDSDLVDDSLSVVHSILIDECQDSIFIADRENSRVLEYGLDFAKKATVVLNNRVWALAKGPYSSVLALTWESAASAKLVALFEGGSLTWEFPTEMDMPHALAIGAAPMEITGVENRNFALYIGNTPSGDTIGELHKFVLSPAIESSKHGLHPGVQTTIDIMDGHEIIRNEIRQTKPRKGTPDKATQDGGEGTTVDRQSVNDMQSINKAEPDSRDDLGTELEGKSETRFVATNIQVLGSSQLSNSQRDKGLLVKSDGLHAEYSAILLSTPETPGQSRTKLFLLFTVTILIIYGVFKYLKKSKLKPRYYRRV